jgi:hypothetical protein
MKKRIQLRVDADQRVHVQDVISLLRLVRHDLQVEVVDEAAGRPIAANPSVVLEEVIEAQGKRHDDGNLEGLDEIGSLLSSVTRRSRFQEYETA